MNTNLQTRFSFTPRQLSDKKENTIIIIFHNLKITHIIYYYTLFIAKQPMMIHPTERKQSHSLDSTFHKINCQLYILLLHKYEKRRRKREIFFPIDGWCVFCKQEKNVIGDNMTSRGSN